MTATAPICECYGEPITGTRYIDKAVGIVDAGRLLALLKRARHFSNGMDLAAYEAIQEDLCILEPPNQPT